MQASYRSSIADYVSYLWAGERRDRTEITPSSKYTITEEKVPMVEYALLMRLTIRDLGSSDFGGYICSAQNTIGQAEGLVRLQGKPLDFSLLRLCFLPLYLNVCVTQSFTWLRLRLPCLRPRPRRPWRSPRGTATVASTPRTRSPLPTPRTTSRESGSDLDRKECRTRTTLLYPSPQRHPLRRRRMYSLPSLPSGVTTELKSLPERFVLLSDFPPSPWLMSSPSPKWGLGGYELLAYTVNGHLRVA